MFFIKHNFFRNFLILIVDRGFQLLSQLFTIFILAKYLGPVQYGYMIYAFSIFSIIYTISNFGLEKTLVVELSAAENIYKRSDFFLSSVLLKTIASVTIIIVVSFLFFNINISILPKQVFCLLFLYSFGAITYSWILIDAYNQSLSQVKYSAYSRIIASVLSLLARIYLVNKGASITLITLSFVFEQFICLLVSIPMSKGFLSFLGKINFKTFVFQKHIVTAGVFVAISSICFNIYFRSFQVVVERNLPPAYLGVFSLMINLFEIPTSLAYIISTIITPKLIQHKILFHQDKNDLNPLLLMLFTFMGFAAAICVLITGFLLGSFLGNQFPDLFVNILRGSIVIPIIFIGFCINTFLFVAQQYRTYFYLSVINTVIIIVYWYLLQKGINPGNAIYMYVLSQLITSIIIPICINRNIFMIFLSFLKLFGKPFQIVNLVKKRFLILMSS